MAGSGPRQRVVVYHEGGAETVFDTAYSTADAWDALLSCHRDHPGVTAEVKDAQLHAEEQEYMGGLDPLI